MKKITMIALLLFAFIQCDKNLTVNYESLLDSISASKYYSSEIINPKYLGLYGTWKVSGTSGGFAGQGYTPNFSHLVIKPYGIFGIVRNDSIISNGKIVIKNQKDTELYVEFISVSSNGNTFFNEKYIQLHNDTLDLISPCCDMFNTHFKKVK
jgi:hypothetical protein